MRSVGGMLFLMLLKMEAAEGTRYTPPGKPKLTSCRSPEKETFTCWWSPAADGGLPTSYALYYRKENSDIVYECPDYHTAGENSCFFNKNDTSIWINYNITVVATNPLGSNYSDPVDVDVVYIVQPHTPENVTATVTEDKDGTFLRVSWEPPSKADTRSGWITLIYELRVKLDGAEEWEQHHAGLQKMFNIFSLRSGGTYLIQVRCKPDHGFWSEWSSTTYAKAPDDVLQESVMWVIALFSALIFLILTCILNMKSNSVKHFLLPPVPGPKIKGLDIQLLKNGGSEDIFNALVVAGFPPFTYSDYDDLLVYLEVNGQEEQELMLAEGKDLHKESLKTQSPPSDCDSGRGSCDSHTLLMQKCGEGEDKGEGEGCKDGSRGEKEENQGPRSSWVKEDLEQARGDGVSPGLSEGRVKTWPSVFSPLDGYRSKPSDRRGSLETAKQRCLSDGSFPPASAASADPARRGYSTKERADLSPGCWEFQLGRKPSPTSLHPQAQLHWRPYSRSEFNIHSVEHKQAANAPTLLSPFHSTEYVEVQRVNQENMVVLRPLLPDSGQREGRALTLQKKDCSKVKGTGSGKTLLLQSGEKVTEEGEGEVVECPCDNQERNGLTESCSTMSNVAPALMTGKPAACLPTAMPLQEEMFLAANGYVDTATMMPN